MAFESLTERLNKAFKNISGQGKLTEKNMDDMLREVRLALLEADVNYKIVKDFLVKVKDKAVGQEVYTSLNPSQMVVKIVHDELVALLGEKEATLNFKESGMTVVMMVGLQGTGKTTSVGKITSLLKRKYNKHPMLIAADVIRPAAIEQLQTLGKEVGAEVFSLGEGKRRGYRLDRYRRPSAYRRSADGRTGEDQGNCQTRRYSVNCRRDDRSGYYQRCAGVP